MAKNKTTFSGLDKGPIIKERVVDRLVDIEKARTRLKKFQEMTLDDFLSQEDNFSLASYWLRIGLEAVLTIGTHILSRLPSNGKQKDYTEVILSLGDYDVIPKEFANKIKGMAGYRNRLVHLYWEVKPDEIFKIIKEELRDFDEFIDHIKNFMEKYEHNL